MKRHVCLREKNCQRKTISKKFVELFNILKYYILKDDSKIFDPEGQRFRKEAAGRSMSEFI